MSQITTHILDTARGKPASGVRVILSGFRGDDWTILGEGRTDSDGRADGLVDAGPLPAGQYKIFFSTNEYFSTLEIESFYPYVEVVFEVSGDGQHYHVPLLLNPFGYSTYRGS